MVFEFDKNLLKIKTDNELVKKVLTSIPLLELKAVKEFANGGSVEEFEKLAHYCSKLYLKECGDGDCSYASYLINTMDSYNVLSCDEEADLDDVILNVLKTKDFAMDEDKHSPYKLKPFLFKHILREIYVPGSMQHSTLKKLDEMFIDSIMTYIFETKDEEELDFYDEMSHKDIVQTVVLHINKDDVKYIRTAYENFLKSHEAFKIV